MDENNEKDKTQHFQNAWVSQLLGYPDDHYFSWINYPRYIIELYDKGILSEPLFNIYNFLRLHANEMGICVISADTIIYNVFKNLVSRGYINKLLRKLRELKLIYFEDHNGIGGNITIYIDDFYLPNKQKTDIKKRFRPNPIAGIETPSSTIETINKNEVIPQADENNRRFGIPSLPVTTTPINTTNQESVVGNNTNNKTNTETKVTKVDNSTSYKEREVKPKYLTNSFNPVAFMNEYERMGYTIGDVVEVWEIAKQFKDSNMDFYLVKLKQYGISLMIRIFGEVKSMIAEGKNIRNPAAYFNTLLTEAWEKRQNEMGENIN